MIPLDGKTGTVSLELARSFGSSGPDYGMQVEADLQAEDYRIGQIRCATNAWLKHRLARNAGEK